MTTETPQDLIAKLEELMAKATPGPLQIRSEYHPERDERCTIIANVDCEIVEGHSHYSYDFVARTLDEFADGPPEAEANAALIVELVNNLPTILTALREQSNVER